MPLHQQLMKTGIEAGGLPPSTLHEVPEKPEDIATNEEARKAYRRAALDVHEENTVLIGRIAKVTSILRTAERYAEFDAIYFPYQVDFRGRVYPVTQLSPQGEDFVKALIQFSEGEALGTQQAADWLAVHIANLFGVDKVSFEDRIQWVLDNEQMLLAIAEDPYTNRQWEDADSPFQAIAAALEWAGYREQGLSWVSRIPVALDGSCSGLHNFGMALRCEATGKAVNLIPADKPADIYQDVIDQVKAELLKLTGDNYAQMNSEAIVYRAREAIRKLYPQYEAKHPDFESWVLQMTSKQYDDDGKVMKRSPEEKEVYDTYWNTIAAFAWLQYGVNPETGKMSRSIAKRAVMTFPYGSKEFGFRDQLKEDIVKPDLKKNGDDSVFASCEWQAMGLMAKLLWQAVNRVVVKAAEAMEWLQKAASMVAKEGQRVSWRTPLGFLVEQGYVTTDEKLGYMTGILYMMPNDSLCPMAASAGCREACLVSAGRAAFTQSIGAARKGRTDFFEQDRVNFMALLVLEIQGVVRKAEKNGMQPAIRLNGTSDIDWTNVPVDGAANIFELFPNVQFYDYTKRPNIVRKAAAIANWHVTASFSASSVKYASQIMHAVNMHDANLAVVFTNGLPETFMGRPVVDGDNSDLRFLDPAKVVVGLKAKGQAKKDKSGFVVDALNVIPLVNVA